MARERSEWEQFFDGHAPEYMTNCFVGNTVEEVDFVIEQLRLSPGDAVLDVGCGTGRHSVELAKRGVMVTGVDLSSGMLAEARKAANEAGVEIELIQCNASDYKPSKRFDGAICLCEGAFSLMGSGDDPVHRDLAILKNVSSALKPGGGFVLTCLSALRQARRFTQDDVRNGVFDPLTMTETSTMEFETPEGKKSVAVRERSYTATELALMLELAGFEVDHIGGGTAGDWGRRQIELDEFELMAISRKP